MTGRLSTIPGFIHFLPSKLTNNFGFYRENEEAILHDLDYKGIDSLEKA